MTLRRIGYNMKLIALLILVAFSTAVPLFAADKASADSVWCEQFDKAQKSGFPKNWSLEGTRLDIPNTVFAVRTDGDLSVLQVLCSKSTGGVVRKVKVDLQKTPVLRWRWRVHTLPPGGDGRAWKTDDQPIAIYILARKNWFQNQALSYRWETLTPKGYEGNIVYSKILDVRFVVLQNNQTAVGEWVTESRNIAEDFKRLFGWIPEEIALSICGNSHHSQSDTVAEIDFIEFIPDRKNKK